MKQTYYIETRTIGGVDRLRDVGNDFDTAYQIFKQAIIHNGELVARHDEAELIFIQHGFMYDFMLYDGADNHISSITLQHRKIKQQD